MQISNIDFRATDDVDRVRGLLGFAGCTIDGKFRLNGLAVRRTADGRMTISFPARRDAAGRDHPVFRPLTDAARREIESRIFAALGLCTDAVRTHRSNR